MATSATPTDGPARPRPSVSILRSLVPYFLVAVAAGVIWGGYFFVYVPPKLQYFVGLRFRTLAVSAGQLKSKIESLAVSVKYADAAFRNNRDNESTYLRFVVPELRDGHDGDGLYVGAWRIAWDDIIAQS